jgi:hypothetical protein
MIKLFAAWRTWMTKFLSKIFLDRFVVQVNLFLLALSILLGIVFYAGKIHGAGDDFNNLAAAAGHGSSLDYVKWYYFNWGQTGIILLVVPFQLVIKLLHVSPEGFPWWLFASINSFCYLASAYMLVIGGKRLLGYQWREALFLLAFIYGVWLTPVVYNSTMDSTVTYFVAFGLPTYLLTIAIYLFSANNFGENRKDWFIVGGIYLLLSVNTETFLLSIPIIFTGMIIVRAIQKNYNLVRILRTVGFFAAISFASVIFVWTQPGFHARPLPLNFHIPSFFEIVQWYARSLDTCLRQILLVNHQYLVKFIHYFIPLLVIIIAPGWIFLYKKNSQSGPYPQIILLLSKGLWTFVLVSGYLFCMLPLLFTNYYPDYLRVYPALLMAGSMGFCISFFIHLFKPGTIRELLKVFDRPFTEQFLDKYVSSWFYLRTLAVGVIIFFVVLNAIPHFNDIYRAYQVELISSAIRQDFQRKIEIAYHETGQNNYIVEGCPKMVDVEQYWGISGFFYWKGMKDVFGVLDTDPNLKGSSPQEVWPDKQSWYMIQCLPLTGEQLSLLQP